MNENVKVVFGLIGGLALFLYGMNKMSDALQKAAGEKMKKVLAVLTKNPIMGALAGALVTAVLQSSSATTVMVIGFVSANLMSLPQAISVIFGANIGTTMTAQLMAFKISDYIYPIIFVGFMMNFVGKKERIKDIGMVAFSFGLLFEGIEIMGSVMKPLASSPVFVDLMGKVSHIPILGLVLGAGMTLVVQSSSATIAVLQNFASQAGPDGVSSVIGLAGAIPILLGDNIGTTITALIASIGQSKNAKRTAVAHSVFNISGSIVFLCLIPIFSKFVAYISPKGNEIDVIARQIANAHTTFNIVCTLVWLPLIPVMVKIVNVIVRGKDTTVVMTHEAKYLDEKMIFQPVPAMYLASREIARLAEQTTELLSTMQESVGGKKSYSVSEKYESLYTGLKELQGLIVSFITKMFSAGVLTEQQSEQTAGLLFVANNLEKIADHCHNVEHVVGKYQDEKKGFSSTAQKEIAKCAALCGEMLTQSIAILETGNISDAASIIKKRNKMKKILKQNNKAHLARVRNKECQAAYTADYSNIMYGFERIADNCINIVEEAENGGSFVNLEQQKMQQLSNEKVEGGVLYEGV